MNRLIQQYNEWHRKGMELSFEFTRKSEELLEEILTIYQGSNDPEIRCLSKVDFVDDCSFVSAWLDDLNRPCCLAKIDGADSMAWRVEFLDLNHKKHLHNLLLGIRNELIGEAKED
jgi:hypothetical protein